MKIAIMFSLLAAGCFAASAPIEVWLTPERRDALKKVAARPYITKQERIDNGTVVYHWANRKGNSVTTQKVERVLGAKSESAWGRKLQKAEDEKAAIISDIDALRKKSSVSKKDLDALAEKHAEKKGKVK